jgi:hypothetical protein
VGLEKEMHMGIKGKRNIARIDPENLTERFIKEYPYSPFQKKVIITVYKMRAVRLNQIARIMNYHPNYIRRELKDLYENRFVDRNFMWEEKVQEKKNQGSAEGIYFLDEAGKVAVSGFLDKDLKDIKWKLMENLVNYDKLKHTLECSEVLAKIYEECRNANLSVIDFLCEKFLWVKFSYQNTQYEFCPDMYVKIMKDKFAYSFFVENDNATMDVKSFLSKVPKYDNYKISGQYETDYDVFPRVLVITTSKERALTLAKEVGKKQKSKVEWLFTWHDIFYEKPFSDKTFIHTSVEQYPRTYSLFDEIPEEAKTGVKKQLLEAAEA